MAYRIIKTIKGRQYIYEQSSRRVGGKVKSTSTYIGPLEPVHRTARSPALLTTQLTDIDIAACLRSADFQRYAADPKSGRYPVALMPERIQETLPHVRRELFLSAETQRKIIDKHPEVSIAEFQRLTHRLDTGEVYLDARASHRVIIVDDGGWWRVVVKATKNGELYLQTYHRSNSRQIAKTKERGNRAL